MGRILKCLFVLVVAFVFSFAFEVAQAKQNDAAAKRSWSDLNRQQDSNLSEAKIIKEEKDREKAAPKVKEKVKFGRDKKDSIDQGNSGWPRGY